MTRAARSMAVFGGYLFVLGAVLVLGPNLLLTALGFEPTTEVYVRIVGMLVFILGYYYVGAARHELTAFFRCTVYGRASVLAFFVIFVALGLAKPMLILFGIIDAAGAVWTALAMRPAGVAQAAH